MGDLGENDRRFLEAISHITYCNPFLPERIEWEQVALGEAFQPESNATWSRISGIGEIDRANVVILTQRANSIAERLRRDLYEEVCGDARLFRLYNDLVTYVLHYRYFATVIDEMARTSAPQRLARWKAFDRDYRHFLPNPGPARGEATGQRSVDAPEHIFACLDQVRRAFSHIFDLIIGQSAPTARLRAKVWQSIFTHDMRRYRRTLYRRMADISTLITGPSGSGKDLVAQAIGQSQYVEFSPKTEKFADDSQGRFVPLNLSAFSPQLIESELFGHRKGAFTGATADSAGWLERCPPYGALFLDEIGELDPAIQVKLLRVIQSRVYARLGDTAERRFVGKVIAATNRNLTEEMRRGRFRMDLFYRLCADHIETPSLREQLDDHPQAIDRLIHSLAERIAGDEADSVAAETQEWIAKSLRPNYEWPGNIRELEQCVRNILVRRSYVPQPLAAETNLGPHWLADAEARRLTADELLRRYVTWVYFTAGTYEATAEILRLDRRTVKAKLDPSWLNELGET